MLLIETRFTSMFSAGNMHQHAAKEITLWSGWAVRYGASDPFLRSCPPPPPGHRFQFKQPRCLGGCIGPNGLKSGRTRLSGTLSGINPAGDEGATWQTTTLLRKGIHQGPREQRQSVLQSGGQGSCGFLCPF